MTLLTMTNNYDNYHLVYFPNLVNDINSDIISYNYPIIEHKKEVFEKNEQDYITIHLTGYGALNDSNEMVYIYDEEYHGIIYLNNRTNFQITLSNYLITYNVTSYKIYYTLKNDEFCVNIKLIGYNTTNTDKNTKYLEHEFKTLLDELFMYTKTNQIDIFNINHLAKIKNSSLTYQTATLNYNFDININ